MGSEQDMLERLEKGSVMLLRTRGPVGLVAGKADVQEV